MFFPDDFTKQMIRLLGEEWPKLAQALDGPTPISIRLNPAKRVDTLPTTDAVPWHPNGYYLAERPIFTLDPLFHAGAYYVQEASSMFLAEALKQCIDLDTPIKALDLCAAPGGKSTLLASLISSESILLANEVIKNRYSTLRQNLQKWGLPITHTSNQDSEGFQQLDGFFDVVLVDAPCSGEGLFRKDEHARSEWSAEHVTLCVGRQKRILSNAAELVKAGGVLLYSTCTYNDQENKNNTAWLMETFDFEAIELSIPEKWGIVEKAYGYQFYPHRLRGEGFYLACLRKKGVFQTKKNKKSKPKKVLNPITKKQVELLKPWIKHSESYRFFFDHRDNVVAIPQAQVEVVFEMASTLRRYDLGLDIGVFKGINFIPSHSLALSTLLHPDVPAVELERQEALLFLKKETFPISNPNKGWHLAKYRGLPLGWMKLLPNRMNNYLPKEWRIRMRVE